METVKPTYVQYCWYFSPFLRGEDFFNSVLARVKTAKGEHEHVMLNIT
jgi:hypothetical protein